jgi:cobalt-zinc-cadmium efflux system outer membrane protein
VRSLAYGLFAAQEKAAAAGEVADRFQALREVLVQRDSAGLTPQLETRIIEATELTMQRRATTQNSPLVFSLRKASFARRITLDRYGIAV